MFYQLIFRMWQRTKIVMHYKKYPVVTSADETRCMTEFGEVAHSCHLWFSLYCKAD